MLRIDTNDFEVFTSIHETRCLGHYLDEYDGSVVTINFGNPEEEAIVADDLIVEHVYFERE